MKFHLGKPRGIGLASPVEVITSNNQNFPTYELETNISFDTQQATGNETRRDSNRIGIVFFFKCILSYAFCYNKKKQNEHNHSKKINLHRNTCREMKQKS